MAGIKRQIHLVLKESRIVRLGGRTRLAQDQLKIRIRFCGKRFVLRSPHGLDQCDQARNDVMPAIEPCNGTQVHATYMWRVPLYDYCGLISPGKHPALVTGRIQVRPQDQRGVVREVCVRNGLCI
jgi:hypothetical protein